MSSITINKSMLLDLISLISNYFGKSFYLYFLYLFTLKLNKINKVSFYLIPLILIIIAICLRNSNNVYLGFQSFRYFFGWLIFAFIFLNSSIKFPILQLYKLICILTIVETVLVNTVITIELMPNNNFDLSSGSGSGYITNYFGFYQRPLGICGNSSITSSLIVILMSLNINKGKSIWCLYGLSSIILLMSGTGIFLYFILVIITSGIYFIVFGIFGLNLYIAFISPWLEKWNWKLSLDGIIALADFKYKQFGDLLMLNDLIFGAAGQNRVGFMADIGWTTAIEYFGILLTIIILTALLLSYINGKQYRKMIVILFFSGFHYSIIFNFFGHIIFGYVIADIIKSRNYTKNRKNLLLKYYDK